MQKDAAEFETVTAAVGPPKRAGVIGVWKSAASPRCDKREKKMSLRVEIVPRASCRVFFCLIYCFPSAALLSCRRDVAAFGSEGVCFN